MERLAQYEFLSGPAEESEPIRNRDPACAELAIKGRVRLCVPTAREIPCALTGRPK